MRNSGILIFPLVLLFVLPGAQKIPAQESPMVRRQAIRKLNEIKPPNTKKFVYKISVPQKMPALPENLRLDLVYKIGHYEFRYVALRLEKERGADFVDVTRFIYGSALSFWREYSDYAKGDAYFAEQAKLPVADFDKLLNLAYLLHQSNIEEIHIKPKALKFPITGSGIGARTVSSSSSDGTIILNLLDPENGFRPVIKESETLISGELKKRAAESYERLRTHLFWEVFYDYFERNKNIFTALDKAKAEEIAVSRLAETPMIDASDDYYRQSLYVEILGELGTIKALPILKKLSEDNSLEENWNKYLKQDAAKAIEKIKGREKSGG